MVKEDTFADALVEVMCENQNKYNPDISTWPKCVNSKSFWF